MILIYIFSGTFSSDYIIFTFFNQYKKILDVKFFDFQFTADLYVLKVLNTLKNWAHQFAFTFKTESESSALMSCLFAYHFKKRTVDSVEVTANDKMFSNNNSFEKMTWGSNKIHPN